MKKLAAALRSEQASAAHWKQFGRQEELKRQEAELVAAQRLRESEEMAHRAEL